MEWGKKSINQSLSEMNHKPFSVMSFRLLTVAGDRFVVDKWGSLKFVCVGSGVQPYKRNN